ncbi:MAG: hydroxyacylglutathione hydrolase [Rubritalea sp.]|jgi:hydroxyacylglutathione hydrolase
MIEDDFNDVLGKAIRGLGFDVDSLNLDPVRLKNCLRGEFDAEIIQALAPALNLNTERLLDLPNYQPELELELEGCIPAAVRIFISSFGHLGVNAFTVENDSHLLIFDTGTNAEECVDYISPFQEKEKHLFITHPHADHLGCEDELLPHVNTSQLLKPGKVLTFGKLTLTSLDVAGHSVPATAYLIEGLETPLCIVGDAIFAGSIGGISQDNYKLALNNIHKNILTLPANTILLNGHGPATSVGLELKHNPFL